MKVALFWSEGEVGRAVLRKLTDGGDFVCVYTDAPAKARIDSINYEIQRGGVHDAEAMERTVQDADVVVCLIEPISRGSKKDISTPYADGIENVLSVMKKYGKSRIYLVAPVCNAEKEKGRILRFFTKFLRSFALHVYRDACKAIEEVKNSGADFTVIRYMNPYLKNKKAGYLISEDGSKAKAGVSGENLARCVCDVVRGNLYGGCMPVVYNKKQD